MAFSSSFFTAATISGPALGGFLYGLGPVWVYSLCISGFVGAALIVSRLGGRRFTPEVTAASRYERVAEGVKFVRSRPVVLGAISLDLFAVLLGGATALLPVYARDILHAGPLGLGFLRSAPAAGAFSMAFFLTHWPLRQKVGAKMFAAVAVFGIATIVFGFSTWFPLSLLALFVLGASDMVSVNIRGSLIQLSTPDYMRGRVSGVSMLFIGASNELGEFESGTTAALMGTVPAVVAGGIGTLLVVGLWMKLFPPLRQVNKFADVTIPI
jgi:MFS family permease